MSIEAQKRLLGDESNEEHQEKSSFGWHKSHLYYVSLILTASILPLFVLLSAEFFQFKP